MKKWHVPDNTILRIAISGHSGCGNTTVTRMLAEILHISFINYTFRSLAEETGMSLAQIIEGAKTNDSFDRTVDQKQVEMAMAGSCVLGSRLAIWMLKQSDFKIFLTASEQKRAQRIQKREGGDLHEIMKFTKMRDAEDTHRYRQLYDIDNTDYIFADMVIDTEELNPEQIIELILSALAHKGLIQSD